MTTAGTPSGLQPRQQDLLNGEYPDMLACVRCGLCLTSCPTYVLTGNEAEGPRGRVAMMRALTEGYLDLTPDLVKHEQNCLVCDACSAVCPVGIHMSAMQIALRSAIEPELHRPRQQSWLRRLAFRRIFADMNTFRRVVGLLRLYQRSGLQFVARRLGILRLLRLSVTERLLPRIPSHFLVPKGEVYLPEFSQSDAAETTRVSFLSGCVMSTALAEIDRSTIRVLQRAGCAVENTAGQGCCGALNAHGGDLEGAKQLARRNISAFERSDGPVIVNSAGCGAMLKEYAHLFRDDADWAERAAAFSSRVRDVTEFLATRTLPMRRSLEPSSTHPAGTFSGTFNVTYQEPCHLAHAQKISRQPRQLLNAIPGLQLREMQESSLCCGSAGVYNVTNQRESLLLRERKLDNALATDPAVIATANPGCLMQLRAGLAERGSTVRVQHIIELLDAATAP